ncbi:hypothetical protein BJ742DRAFT_839578 [Cladochytrium replicatum]|nr:hypothetical protein BJ742DRAFT_839578 [Cladochytrium replicatum]
MAFNSVEPTVIDEELLRKAVNEQVSQEIAEIARKEGINPTECTSLRLDYKNILQIDNLWAFENLTKLQLDNNIIERVENISFLKNLQWLDLSFNNITQIEGLDNLTKLTDLSLYNNRISKMDNMDDLVSLQVLSIGNNNLSQLENFAYLTRFENLRVLNAAGNTVCKITNYQNYILAHIRGLKYLDYRLVDESAVAAAREQYIDDLIAMEEEDKVATAGKEAKVKQAALDSIHEASHIIGIDALFDDMFGADPDFRRLFPIAREAITELKDEYRLKFEAISVELKNTVLKKHGEKQGELSMFKTCVNEAKSERDQECLKQIDRYQNTKKKMIRVIMFSRDTREVEEALKLLKDQTQALSDVLMGHEMTLVEQFEDVAKEFERNYTEMCGAIVELGQAAFARLRELENEFHERFTETVLTAFDRFNKGDMDELEDEIRDIMTDKDTLVNAINGSHDYRFSKFDYQEDTLVSGVQRDLEKDIQAAHEEEIRRNRDRVCEIISFMEKCRLDIEQAEDAI